MDVVGSNPYFNKASSKLASPTDASRSIGVSVTERASHPDRHNCSITPPSSLCASSPELPTSLGVSRRVRTREDSQSSALAFLASVCSSPSVRWDGRRHRYKEEKERPISEEDVSGDTGVLVSASFAGDTANRASSVHLEHSLVHISPGDVEDHDDDGGHEALFPQESPCLADEDEDSHTPKIPAEYFLDFTPSSPTAHSLSSPVCRMSYDFSSSSERSVTLPLSSPGPSHFKQPLLCPSASAGAASRITRISCTYPSEDSGQHWDTNVEHVVLKTEALDIPIPQIGQTGLRFSEPANMVIKNSAHLLPPVHAPSTPPPIQLDTALSPTSSVLSSPPPELFDPEPKSAVSNCYSICSSVVSSRSATPDVCMIDGITKPIGTGRRASTNVIGSICREDMRVLHSQRSDTAPPEPTPRKRQRRSSPLSPARHALQVRRILSTRSPSPSCSKALSTSSRTYEENRQIDRKSKPKPRKTTTSTMLSSKSNRINDAQHRISKVQSSVSKSKTKPISNAHSLTVNSISASELATLPMTGFLVETLALSRASAITAPELLRTVLKSQPHLILERSEESWSPLVRCILENVGMFGRIERSGTDAADRPLEDQWFYVPENDKEEGRAELLKGLMPNKRNVTKRSKQYYFEPVHKISRWDPEDE